MKVTITHTDGRLCSEYYAESALCRYVWAVADTKTIREFDAFAKNMIGSYEARPWDLA